MNIRLKVKDKINKRHNKKHIQNKKCYEYKERPKKKSARIKVLENKKQENNDKNLKVLEFKDKKVKVLEFKDKN